MIDCTSCSTVIEDSAFLELMELAESKGDAKRKIEQGGVSVDGQKIELGQEVLKEWDGKILKVGRKDFRRIVIK